VLLYLDKIEELIRVCDKLLLTWKTHEPPLGDRKVKETTYRTISKTADELEQWRDNSSTDDTLTSLTLIETSLGNNPQIQQWWYEVMSTRPPLLPKNEEKYREEILDRIEKGWQGEEWAINMPQIAKEIFHQILPTKKTPPAT